MDFKSIALTTRPPQPSCSFDRHELVYIQYSVTSASMVQTTRMQAHVMHICSGMCCLVKHACRQLASTWSCIGCVHGGQRSVRLPKLWDHPKRTAESSTDVRSSTWTCRATCQIINMDLQDMSDHQHGPAGQQARLSTEQHAWSLT